MKSDRSFPVAIIGGGASGTILAAQLARRNIASALVDGSGRMSKGVAYSTREAGHLLNVRAANMSAWTDQPNDFADRFKAAGGHASGFAQRRFFGQYLGKILQESVASGLVDEVHRSAIGAHWADGLWLIEFDDGSSLRAEALVLATGNQEPDRPKAFEKWKQRFVGNPWSEAAQEAVAELAAGRSDAFMLGTGLTMVDLVVSLDASGFSGRILALSRRGLAPRAHVNPEGERISIDSIPANLRDLVKYVRRGSANKEWRSVVDSLRPHTHRIWQGLRPHEQRQFLRHVRPWWDVHRHRIAPEVAAIISRLTQEDRLEIVAGRVVDASANDEAIAIRFRRRGETEVEQRSFGFAFNCTGPLHSVERSRDPLLRSLFDSQMVRSDHLKIGLEVDEHARAGNRIWALGPLTKGRYWEIIAVPDIREQAAMIAGDIARELEK